MRKFLIMLPLIVLTSCCIETKYKDKETKYKFVVSCSNGSGMNSSWYNIKCDSVKMLSTKKAEVYVDGTKLLIEATNHISVGSLKN